MPHNNDPTEEDYAVSSPLSDVSGMSDDFEHWFPEKKPGAPAAQPVLLPTKPVVIEISDDEAPAALPKRSRQAETEVQNQARLEHLTMKWGPSDKRDSRRWQAPTPAIRHQGLATTPQLHTLIKPIQPPASYHNKSLAVSRSLLYRELPSFTRRAHHPGQDTDGGRNLSGPRPHCPKRSQDLTPLYPRGPNAPGLRPPSPKRSQGPTPLYPRGPNLPGLRPPSPKRSQGLTPLYPRGPNAPGPNRGLIPPYPRALDLHITNRAHSEYLPAPPRPLTHYRTATGPGRAGAALELPRLPFSFQFPTQPTTPGIFYGSGPPAPPRTMPHKNTPIILSSPLELATESITPQQVTQAIPSSPPSSPELPPYAWLDKTGTSIARLHGAIRGVLAQGNEDVIRDLARELRHDWEVDEMAIYVEGFVRGALFDRVA